MRRSFCVPLCLFQIGGFLWHKLLWIGNEGRLAALAGSAVSRAIIEDVPDKTLLDSASAKAGDTVHVSLEPIKEWIKPDVQTPLLF